MNEVKQPKKPLIYYYVIVLLVLMLFNFLAMPWILQRQVREVDYGTFISMTEEKHISKQLYTRSIWTNPTRLLQISSLL